MNIMNIFKRKNTPDTESKPEKVVEIMESLEDAPVISTEILDDFRNCKIGNFRQLGG